MQIGKYKHRVTVQTRSVTRDDFGGEVPAWTDRGTFWAKVEPIRMREFVKLRMAQTELDLRVEMRYRSDIVADSRLVWKGKIYEIISVVDVDAAGKRLELLCKSEHPSEQTS